MKPLWHVMVALIVLGGLALGSRVCAQAAAGASSSSSGPIYEPSAQELFDTLRTATANLTVAGNYTWTRCDEREIQGKTRRMPPRAEGETEIGSFTTVVAQRRKMVFLRDEVAYLLQAGWRHGIELTEANFDEMRLLGMSRASQERWRQPTQPLPHELLALVLKAVNNLRNEGPVIVGDINRGLLPIAELESYLLFGQLKKRDLAQTVRNVLHPSTIPIATRATERGEATVSIWLDKDQIEELLVSIRYGSTTAQGHAYKLEKIGTTRVMVEPEAHVLFRNAPATK